MPQQKHSLVLLQKKLTRNHGHLSVHLTCWHPQHYCEGNHCHNHKLHWRQEGWCYCYCVLICRHFHTFFSFVVSNIVNHVLKRDVAIWIRMVYLGAQSFKAVPYYYGNNIVDIIVPYREDLRCDRNYIMVTQMSTTIASVGALMFYHDFNLAVTHLEGTKPYMNSTALCEEVVLLV